MPVEILMPKLGLTMTEGKIIEWRKNEGDQVNVGEIIFVLETEKVVHEVESPAEGILGRIVAAQEETVPVGAIVAFLLKPGETADAIPAGPPPAAAVESAGEAQPSPVVESQPSPVTQSTGGRVRATPLAKKMARQAGIDISMIKGTGPTGRVIAEDVRNAPAAAPVSSLPEAPADRLVPLTGMRKAIAQNMMAAKVDTAQTYMSLSADASAIVKYRRDLLSHIEKKYEVKLTITDLMMKVTGAAIKEHNVINTAVHDSKLVVQVFDVVFEKVLDLGEFVRVLRAERRRNRDEQQYCSEYRRDQTHWALKTHGYFSRYWIRRQPKTSFGQTI